MRSDGPGGVVVAGKDDIRLECLDFDEALLRRLLKPLLSGVSFGVEKKLFDDDIDTLKDIAYSLMLVGALEVVDMVAVDYENTLWRFTLRKG